HMSRQLERVVGVRKVRPTRAQLRAHLSLIAAKKRPGARIRTAVRRAFIASNSEPICISDVLKRAYPRLKVYPHKHRWSVRRALLIDAEVIGRRRFGRGRPNLWLPK